MFKKRQRVIIMHTEPNVLDLNCGNISCYRNRRDGMPWRRVWRVNCFVYCSDEGVSRVPFQTALIVANAAQFFMHGASKFFWIILTHAIDIGLHNCGNIGASLYIQHYSSPCLFWLRHFSGRQNLTAIVSLLMGPPARVSHTLSITTASPNTPNGSSNKDTRCFLRTTNSKWPSAEEVSVL